MAGTGELFAGQAHSSFLPFAPQRRGKDCPENACVIKKNVTPAVDKAKINIIATAAPFA